MTADDFELQPRGPYLLNFWHARHRVPTPVGEFVVEAQMDLEDLDPPDSELVRRANELAAFASARHGDILDRIYEHYKIVAEQEEWMEQCGVPVGLSREGILGYVKTLSLVVERARDREPAYGSTIYVVHRWDEEHAIYLEVRGNRVEFKEL